LPVNPRPALEGPRRGPSRAGRPLIVDTSLKGDNFPDIGGGELRDGKALA